MRDLRRNWLHGLRLYRNAQMRRAAKVDKNQAEIVDALRDVGAVVTSIHRHGEGVPDILVSFRGVWYLMEVKASDGRLTPDEKEFIDRHHNATVHVVRHIDDALDAIGVI